MESSKKILLTTIVIAVLIVVLSGVTFAFFNYTRTGSSNVIKVGRINFVSRQTNTINLTNLFPIDPTDNNAMNDNTKVGTLEIEIEGDTDYNDGVEYLISSVNSNISINGKTLPISLDIELDDLGTENSNYFTARESKNATIYKKLVGTTLKGDEPILVGFIKKNTTSGTAEGINGSITIKAYLDENKILISDTYDGTESDNMGTPNSMAEGKTVFTTNEWNTIQTSGVSFQVRVEANEGLWVSEPLTLTEAISRKVSTANYIASYDDIITQNPTYTTQDQVSTSSSKQTVYYYTGNNAAANANVVFAGYCWQVIRTTDNGGVKMIYNGVATKPVTSSTPITNTDITYTNDTSYPYTYDTNTKKWTSANAGVASTTDTFIFNVNIAGDYVINYTVSSKANNDIAKFYINNELLGQHSGEEEGVFDLGTLATADTVKIEYTKDASTDTGNDNIVFDIANVTGRGTTQICSTERRATRGINGTNAGSSTSLSGATLFGRSYDYDLATGQFTIEDSTGLPTAWSENDSNNNGKKDYEELIGTYTCLSNSATCTTLYYIGSYASSTNAYTASYTIGDVAHYSQMGTSAFNANSKSPALVGYMFNKEYDYKSGSKSGEYYGSAVWENGAYILSNGNSGTAPDATHHYICDTNCTKVRYYYYVSGSVYYYILLENGKTVEDALKEMINYKTNANDADENINVYNSAIKGYLDNWYKKNLTAYASYLDNEAVFCNDRSVRDLGGWNSSGTNLSGSLQFYQYSANNDLSCVNETDRFSKSNNKAKLDYSIGILSEPERNLMTTSFAKTGQNYWTLSSYYFNNYNAYVRNVGTSGTYINYFAYGGYGSRGVVTLKPGTNLEKGTGTYADPYIVGPIVER